MRLLKVLFPVILVVLGCWYNTGCNTGTGKVALDVTAEPFKNLSEYGFFTGTLKDLKANERVVPYDLVTPLFTDYAHKTRFVYLPEGKSADYDTTGVLQFPVGTCLIKTFYYPEDFRKPEAERRIIETRLLVHREAGWDNLAYIWNDEQTDAELDIAGDIKEVKWTHYDGSARKVDYVIPSKNQCKSCHWRNDASFTPIGPKVRNLNRDYTYADGTENQLLRWTKLGILKNGPAPAAAPKIASWTDSTHTLNQRARAYLEMNCGHCHSPNGPAYTSGLHLNLENANPENLGFCKSPVAAGKATGNFMYDIVPGHPELSILTFRMESTDPGIKMPEIGRGLVHKEGVELISRWIAEMKESDCKVQQ